MLAEYIFKTAVENPNNLEVVWIPREINELADRLSENCDKNDSKTSDKFFQYLVFRDLL